jgi:site-specific DNA-methyltransferase (adenine-specific)
MNNINDETIDLVVTDPPYGMNYIGNRRSEKPNNWGEIEREKFEHIHNDTGEDFEELIKKYIAACHRIMKDNTAMYMFCS